MACSRLLRWNEPALLPAACWLGRSSDPFPRALTSPRKRPRASARQSVQQRGRNVSALAELIAGVAEVQDSLSERTKLSKMFQGRIQSNLCHLVMQARQEDFKMEKVLFPSPVKCCGNKRHQGWS
ncbi:uncharacterized protein RG961_010523 [Leptosomus discolor]